MGGVRRSLSSLMERVRVSVGVNEELSRRVTTTTVRFNREDYERQVCVRKGESDSDVEGSFNS